MDLIGLPVDGLLIPREIAKQLTTTSAEVLRSAGLEREASKRSKRINFDEIQRRLQGMMSVLNKIASCFGSTVIAYAWYRSQPLPGFSGQTPMHLVLNERSDEVLEYINAVDASINA